MLTSTLEQATFVDGKGNIFELLNKYGDLKRNGKPVYKNLIRKKYEDIMWQLIDKLPPGDDRAMLLGKSWDCLKRPSSRRFVATDYQRCYYQNFVEVYTALYMDGTLIQEYYQGYEDGLFKETTYDKLEPTKLWGLLDSATDDDRIEFMERHNIIRLPS